MGTLSLNTTNDDVNDDSEDILLGDLFTSKDNENIKVVKVRSEEVNQYSF